MKKKQSTNINRKYKECFHFSRHSLTYAYALHFSKLNSNIVQFIIISSFSTSEKKFTVCQTAGWRSPFVRFSCFTLSPRSLVRSRVSVVGSLTTDFLQFHSLLHSLSDCARSQMWKKSQVQWYQNYIHNSVWVQLIARFFSEFHIFKSHEIESLLEKNFIIYFVTELE